MSLKYYVTKVQLSTAQNRHFEVSIKEYVSLTFSYKSCNESVFPLKFFLQLRVRRAVGLHVNMKHSMNSAVKQR